MDKIFVFDELLPAIERQHSLLSRNSITVFTAPTAEEALRIHLDEGMDLIITDIGMPRMGGDRLCAAIRQGEGGRCKAYVILVCSGTKHELKRLVECGASAYLSRPLDLPGVIAKVAELLEIPRRHDLRVLVKVTVRGSFRADSFFCTSRDISASGILVDTDKTLAKGDVISCSFFLPNTSRIKVEGEVVRVIRGMLNTYSYGVRYMEISEDSRAEIASFIEAGSGMR